MNFWLRDHDPEKADHQPDGNGQTYTTVSRDQANAITDRATRAGHDVYDDNLSPSRIPIVGEITDRVVTLYDTPQGGIDHPGKVDILVTEEDSFGIDSPTKRHGPGY